MLLAAALILRFVATTAVGPGFATRSFIRFLLLATTTTLRLWILAFHTVEISRYLALDARIDLLEDVALTAFAPFGIWSSLSLVVSAWIALGLDTTVTTSWFLATSLLPSS